MICSLSGEDEFKDSFAEDSFFELMEDVIELIDAFVNNPDIVNHPAYLKKHMDILAQRALDFQNTISKKGYAGVNHRPPGLRLLALQLLRTIAPGMVKHCKYKTFSFLFW